MPFDFNIYSSLLLPPFIQGVFFALLLFYRGWTADRLSDKLLGWLLLLNAVRIAYWMLGFAGWYDTHDDFTSFMFYFPFNNVIWMGPLLYFYFLSLTNTDFRFSKRHRKHLLLPAGWLTLMIIKFVVDFSLNRPFPVIEETQYGTKGPLADLEKNAWFDLAALLSFAYYLFITLKAFRTYQSYVKQNFSSTDEIRFDWLRNLLYTISAGVLVFFLFELVGLLNNGITYKFQWYAYLGLGIVIYYLSIAGYFTYPRSLQRLHFEPAKESAPKVTNEDIIEAKPELDKWKQRLLEHMERGKPYLEPELSLADLAKRLNTNTSVLSKVINDGTGRNFNDFINSYRVQEVIQKLKQGEQKTQTLLGIAYDCGFNSKATFNRSFKKVTEKTPKEFIESLTTG
ncbi:MAG: helix-turn-helix transcriptional regulator [Chitinophagaceae bacterium]|nr:helix-turn-helix transcriptional regulator [Chitinophagaceae bacterium]